MNNSREITAYALTLRRVRPPASLGQRVEAGRSQLGDAAARDRLQTGSTRMAEHATEMFVYRDGRLRSDYCLRLDI